MQPDGNASHLHHSKASVDEQCQERTRHQQELYPEGVLLLVVGASDGLVDTHVPDDPK